MAVVREEGSNGDREMSVSLYMAGFEVTLQSSYDLNMHLLTSAVKCMTLVYVCVCVCV